MQLFDTDFDKGNDISDALDLSKALRPLQVQKRDTRQSIINVWLAEWLERTASNKLRNAG